jgi:hypothetical protein
VRTAAACRVVRCPARLLSPFRVSHSGSCADRTRCHSPWPQQVLRYPNALYLHGLILRSWFRVRVLLRTRSGAVVGRTAIPGRNGPGSCCIVGHQTPESDGNCSRQDRVGLIKSTAIIVCLDACVTFHARTLVLHAREYQLPYAEPTFTIVSL